MRQLLLSLLFAHVDHALFPASKGLNKTAYNLADVRGDLDENPCIPGAPTSQNLDWQLTTKAQARSLDEKEVIGSIVKHWTGKIDSSSFRIQFPLDLCAKLKTILLGACFLIIISTSIPRPLGTAESQASNKKEKADEADIPSHIVHTQAQGQKEREYKDKENGGDLVCCRPRLPFPKGSSRQATPHYGMGYPPPYHVPPAPGHPAMWMPTPPRIPNCPPGLEYLTQIDKLIIHQQIEVLELIFGFETNNKYEIKNALWQRVYFATEVNDCLTLNCCGTIRPFTIKIYDNMGQQVIELMRPLRCDGCCCPCCLQELEVYAPPGIPVGFVKQIWHPCLPKFVVQNEARQDVLLINGPCVVCSCCGDVNFDVLSLDEQHVVGRIAKHWSGFVKELFTDVDNFGVQFPMDLDVKMKAVMLGACFLIDFMYFETTGSTADQSLGVWH
ncbi:hypothetical protein lerEdw1_008179 [Lerista edwardsae]|nr:hypothetical protein lerEdw1_008179 [Lerista edwardsae]